MTCKRVKARRGRSSIGRTGTLVMLSSALGLVGIDREERASAATAEEQSAACEPTGYVLGSDGHFTAPPGGVSVTTAPPAIVQVDPEAGAVDIDVESALELTFSAEPILTRASVRAQLSDSSGTFLLGTTQLDANVATWAPESPFESGQTYPLSLDSIVVDENGIEWSCAAQTRFETREGEWGTPESIDGPYAFAPELAFDAEGKALLAWESLPPRSRATLKLASYTPADHWQEVLAPAAGEIDSAAPVRVAAGEGGDFSLMWHGMDMRAAIYHFGDGTFTAASPPHRYHRYNHQGDTVFAAGRFWFGTSDNLGGLEVAHTEGGQLWPGRKVLSGISEDGGSIVGPVFVADASDRSMHVIYARVAPSRNSEPTLLTIATANYSGDWDDPATLISLEPAHTLGSLKAVGSVGGDLLIGWQDTDSNGASRLRLVSSSAGGVGTARPDGVDTLGNAYGPALALSPIGDALVTWVSSSGSPDDSAAPARAWAATRAADAEDWSAPVALSSSDAVRAGPPALALDTFGDGHAVWVEVDASGSARLMAARFRHETASFGPPRSVSGSAPVAAPTGAQSVVDPRVAVDDFGNALAVWVAPEGELWAARFE